MVPNRMSCLLGIILLLSMASVAELVVRPENAISMEETPITLHCSTSENDSCRWWAAASLGAPLLTVYNGDKTDVQYSVNTSLAGQCDLTILKPRLTSPLVYACVDSKFGKPRYVSLTVLKSNLLCAHNVKRGSRRVNRQTLRYSMNLVYASEMRLSVYVERSNGSAKNVCSDAKKDGKSWRLECDYTVDVNESRPVRFFAAVSDVIMVDDEDIEMDMTVPTERFYCSSNDWPTEESSSASADNVSNFEKTNVSSPVSTVSVEAVSSASHGVSTCIVLFIISLSSALVVIVAVMCLCRSCRRNHESSQEQGDIFHEGEDHKFVPSKPASM